MTTFTVGSAAYNAACERAEQQIRDDLRVGAVEQYIDGESAQQYLGDLLKIHSMVRKEGESLHHWIESIDAKIDFELDQIIEKAVRNNVARVAQENSHD